MKKHTQYLRAEHEAAKKQATYYEQVRDHVERLGECSTSDAQGIIGAWEMRNGNMDPMGDVNMDKAEDAGTTPEEATRITAELVRRWNAFPDLLAALQDLVQTIEWDETSFLNEDAEEGESNPLTRARAAINKAKTL